MAVATKPEEVRDPEAAAEEERKASADISAMARGGLLNLVGAAGTGILTFALVTVLTRGLGPASYGAFVSAMGIFTVLSNTAELGADTGLVRTIARLRALDRVRDIRKTVYVAVIPPLVVGTLFAVAMWVWGSSTLTNWQRRSASGHSCAQYSYGLGSSGSTGGLISASPRSPIQARIA